MTSSLGGFLDGEEGDITYQVPVFVIEHEKGLVLIDTGLHPELTTDTSRLNAIEAMFSVSLPEGESIGPTLEAAGFDPAQVDHLLMTHLHFDHSGGMLEIPNARVTVQADEWAGLSDEMNLAFGIYNPLDCDLGHERNEIEGDHDLFGDGTITCIKTPGHTAGHQSFRIQTEDGTFVICGDCCYLRRTLDDEHLPNFSADAEQQLASIRRLKGEQEAGATMIFGHDPEQWTVVEAEGLHPGV